MHNLNINNGVTSFMYTGPPAWHRLGTQLDHPATAEEAIRHAGLDFSVRLKEVKTVINRKRIVVPNTFATIRTDTQQVLGVVGSRYEVVQNRQAFNFFDALVGEGEGIFETAGA